MNIYNIFTNSNLPLLLGSFTFSLIISYITIPPVRYIVEKLGIYDIPTSRKLHNTKIPILGGVPIIFAWLLTLLFFADFSTLHGFQFFLLAITIIVALGIKDDLSGLSANKKFLGEIVSATIVAMFVEGGRITSFYGIFGIGELPYWISILFTIFVYLIVVNGFNLIDGIDGLAVSIAIVSSVFFGLWFYFTDAPKHYFIIAFALSGGAIPFLRINFTKNIEKKMFMGDTGSLFLGFVLTFITIAFIESYPTQCSLFHIQANPILAMSVIFLPIYDTTRSFFVRIIKGKSPFQPDKNHVHHLLIRLGLKQVSATIILVIYSISVILLALWLSYLKIGYLVMLTIIMSYTIILNIILYSLVKRKEKNA